ncbi:MAG: NADH-quinone oxidoreductase subunit C [Candidatus Paceibacterota bacterium]|jgi:Ni,Fe-hydrogenase III large subunit/Ni,Fe-hydrogenase III component G
MNKEEIIKKYIPSNYRTEEQNNLLMFEVPARDIENVCVGFHNEQKLQLMTITATDERSENGAFKIFYVFGIPKEKMFLVPYITLKNTEEFPSLVVKIHGSSWYEREIMTFFGLIPTDHYYQKRVILHENWPLGVYPLRKDFKWDTRPENAKGEPHQFRKVEGEGIYEIPVGPVHAGIIEPGHFRFSVAGEEIISLEPLLGYKHKGVEKLFEVLPLAKKVALSEGVSGDSSFSHSLAFCQALENLGGVNVPERAKYLRVVYAELERLANHFNDIGFIMLDTGFNFGGANGSRLREMIMQWNEKLTGSRFLRGVNSIGGVEKDVSEEAANKLRTNLEAIESDFRQVMEICFDSNSLMNRLKGTGFMDAQAAIDHDLCGVAARAMGLDLDVRVDYPYAAYDKFEVDVPTESTRDVYARFMVKVREVYVSMNILKKALYVLPPGEIRSKDAIKFKNSSYSVSVTEGWRGNIVYFVSTDRNGEISRVQARDASFLNWAAFPYAVKGNVVPDFPLINKSFNLSYSGYDR